MRSVQFVLIFAVLFLLGADEQQLGPTEFKSKAGGFSVLLPQTPKESEMAGMHFFSVDSKDGSCIVSYHDVEKLRSAGKEELAKMLKASQDGFESTLQGKIAQSEELTLEGKYPGRGYDIELPKESVAIELYRSREYVVDGRMYQLVVKGTKKYAGSKEASLFLASLKLVK